MNPSLETATLSAVPAPKLLSHPSARGAAVVLSKVGRDSRAHAIAAIASNTSTSTNVEVIYFTGTDRNCSLLAVDAFEHVQRYAAEQNRVIGLYIGNAAVRRWLEQQNNQLVHACYFNGSSVSDIRTRAEQLFAEHLAGITPIRQPKIPKAVSPALIIATDASARTHHRGVGIAYVTDTLAWRQDYLTSTSQIAVGELAAIELAVSTETASRIKILTDSRCAVDWCRGRTNAPTREISRRVSHIRHAIAGREVTIQWVKAHAGHRLNETADRLAVAARRNAVADVPVPIRIEIAQRIVADLTTDPAAQLDPAGICNSGGGSPSYL